ncbi:MAG: NADH-quinone oxidoreductase subunit J [Proteobacteria bacterium]|nr:NADH-quinone oxidoreductase subunit J [Pseudomonadota bacterium]
MEAIVFYILAAAATSSAVIALSRRDPLSSAVWLLGLVIPVAAIMALMRAPLAASAFLIVAVGSTLSFCLYVLMLMEPGRRARARQIKFGKVLAAVAAGYLAIVMSIAVAAPPFFAAPASGVHFDSPLTVGKAIASGYALAFALSGLMLMAAAAASVVMAGREGEG